MERSQIHRVSVADQVAGILRQRILQGELRPGASLPEVPLAASLGVSRNTMREAIRILSLEGLVRRNIHRGVTVAQLSLNDVEEIYHLRRMLEISALALGRRSSKELRDELRAAVDGYEKAVRSKDWTRAVSCDLDFHTLFIRLHNNQRLETFYRKVIGELRMGMVLVDRSHDDPSALIPVHRKLYQLFASGKLKQCQGLLMRHLQDSEQRLRRVMSERTATAADRSRANGRGLA